MKNYIITSLWVLLFFVFTACEENNSGYTFGDITPPDNEPESVTYKKKGVCITTKSLTWNQKVAALKPHWHYSWGNELKEGQPDSVEFVPMFWGKTIDDTKVSELKQLASEGKIKYLLGFNEPDGEEQANMTVGEAIALWPKLEEVGVPLGSPAAVNSTNEWFKEFMAKAEENNLRVDFVCVHSYGGLNFNSFKTKLEEVYELYGKPIWITEFAVADWNATTVEENKYTPAQVLQYMKEALPALDEMEFIERYSWFSGSQSSPPLTSSALFYENGNLTTLGNYYANHTPNKATGNVSEPPIYSNIEGNLIENGNFGNYNIYGTPDERAPESVGWFGYQFGVEASDVVEGWACEMKNGWGGESGVNNIFSVETGKTYQISFYAKWLGSNGSISMNLKDNDAVIAWENDGKPAESKPETLASSPAVTAAANNQWTKVNFEYTVPEGVSTLRLTFWKAKNTSGCLLDEVLAVEKL